MKKDVIVFGAGGQAKVVIDILKLSSSYQPVGLFVSKVEKDIVFGLPVHDMSKLAGISTNLGIIAVGDNFTRLSFFQEILKARQDFIFINAIHPKSIQPLNFDHGSGNIYMASSVLNPGVSVGDHCILNTGSILDHDCKLGSFSSVAPGVLVGGNSTIGQSTALGIGAVVIHNISIGNNTVIGAGSLVLDDIVDNVLAYGNPCRVIRPREAHDRYL